MFLPEQNMSPYGRWQTALRSDLADLDWDRITRIQNMELDAALPRPAVVPPVDEDVVVKRIR